MDCQNCGAPVRLVERRGYGMCEFCDSYFFPTPLAESADRITPAGHAGECDCPRCGVRLMAAMIEKVGVEYCERCRGFLVGTEAFSHVVRRRRAEYSGAERIPEPLNREDLGRRIVCPRCRRTMEVHPYYGPGNAVIDSCGGCRLVWMDHGELAGIEAAAGRR